MPDAINNGGLTFYQRTISSALVGVVNAFAMTPLDVIKIRMQETMVSIVRNEGFTSLWTGISPALLMALPQTIIYYTVNDFLKDQIGYFRNQLDQPINDGSSHHPTRHKTVGQGDLTPALIGGASRIFAAGAMSPIELIRTKMQATPTSPIELLSNIGSVIKQDGILVLWTGLGPTLLRDVPFSMIFWLVFDYFKSDYLITRQKSILVESLDTQSSFTTNPSAHPLRFQSNQLPFFNAFTYGAIGGAIAGVVTHPFDVIKTHRQVLIGFTPRLCKTTSTCAIVNAIFEWSKGYFESKARINST